MPKEQFLQASCPQIISLIKKVKIIFSYTEQLTVLQIRFSNCVINAVTTELACNINSVLQHKLASFLDIF